MINFDMSDTGIRKELGRRIQANRLLRNIDQEHCASEAGVSVSTLYRLEKGGSVSVDALIKVLRSLGLLDRLDLLVPVPEIGPVQRAKERKPVTRQRASGGRKAKTKVENRDSGWPGFKQPVRFDD